MRRGRLRRREIDCGDRGPGAADGLLLLRQQVALRPRQRLHRPGPRQRIAWRRLSGVAPGPDLVYLLRRGLLELLGDALLRLVTPLGVVELAFVAVCALLAVRTRLLVEGDRPGAEHGRARRGRHLLLQEVLQGRPVSPQWIVGRHESVRKELLQQHYYNK